MQGRGEPRVVGIAEQGRTRRLDMHDGPGTAQRIGNALGGPHKFGRAMLFAHGDDDPLARRPVPGQRMGAQIVEHLRIDCLGRPPEGKLAQRGQVRFGKVVAERPRRFRRDIDLALLQPFDELVRRNVDHLDVGILDHAVGQRLAHPHLGERRHDVVQALEMLDVDGRINVDAGGQQLFHILIALVVPAAGRVRMRKLVDQHELRPSRKDRVHVHLGQGAPLILHRLPGDDLQPVDQRFGLDATMGLHHPDDHIHAVALARHRLGQHFVGLAHARRGAEEDLETPTALLRGLAQKGLGIRAKVGRRLRTHGALVAVFAVKVSSVLLSISTLTRGSPRMPSRGRSVWPATSARTCAVGRPRAFATRSTWNKAASGLTWGSSPEAEVVTRSAGGT